MGKLGTIVGGATPSTKNPENYGGEISWITPKDLAGYAYRGISRGERNITKAGFDSCSTIMLPVGAILFSSRAPIGYVALAEHELCTNQGFKSLIPNEQLDSLFGYYLLKFNAGKIDSLGSGTTFKEVSASTMRQVDVLVPDVPTQRKIAAVLGALDDKIELNRRMNENLEAMAQALFKSWFVDFEPFGGQMPKGWRMGTLGEIAEYADDRIDVDEITPENYYSTENLQANKGGVVSAASLPDTLKVPACFPGDILVSNIRPYFKKIHRCQVVGGRSADVLCFRARENNGSTANCRHIVFGRCGDPA